MTSVENQPLISVEDLHVEFRGKRKVLGGGIKAVRGVSFEISANETMALVGESGSGKTTTGRALLGLSPITGGTIRLRGRDITNVAGKERRSLRREIQMIYQNPYDSLTPHMSVYELVAEPLRVNKLVDKGGAEFERVGNLLEIVGLPSRFWGRHPRSLSGGQLQRVAIARALSVDPGLLVADEPVAKLDVSIQAQVINLMRDLQAELGMSSLFITHNLALVRYVAHHVGIMYRGELVEVGTTEQILHDPKHSYTQALLAAVPKITMV